ncbi:hypothetical protein ILYODFUR_001831 [Ilyodon furcidens]|uniref:Secreted protein n=1 Tax=Ilyodon furcidens TaxID=33524 RepID=A0ABV0T4H8_9TELE
MQATFLSPLWVFLGSFFACQRLVTPKSRRQRYSLQYLLLYTLDSPVTATTYSTVPTFEAMTFGDSNDINHLILVKDSRNGHSFLQVLLGPVHFIWDCAPIQLHLHDVSLLLLYRQQSHLETKELVVK